MIERKLKKYRGVSDTVMNRKAREGCKDGQVMCPNIEGYEKRDR